MTSNSPRQSSKSPSAEEARLFHLSIAASQTSYELNNGFGLMPGMPLRYVDDSSALNIPGARPLKVAEFDGFIVQDVFTNNKTGLNAFIAFNKATGELIIGVAGTNGFGSDWPDTKEDLLRLGSKQLSELIESDLFIQALQQSIDKVGGIKALNRIVIGGQSLGGGIASILGLGLVHGAPRGDKRDFYKSLGIPPEKIFSVSINGFGNEYSAELAGFTKEEVRLFNQNAALHRIVVKNVNTGEFDLVSQLGGEFSGTNWILPVEVANGLWPLHRLNFGGAEGIDNLYGDLTLLRSGTVPKLDHASLARNLFWLDSHLDLPNNPVSLTWASYVALLVSKPGEASAALSAMLQSVTDIPKPLTDIAGALSELILRVLPVTHAAQALQFLIGGYFGGRMIGSINSPQPVLDLAAILGPVQEGWTRWVENFPDTNRPAFIADTNPNTNIVVIRQLDGRAIEIHPDGLQIQTHPEYGIAVIHGDGHGTLYIRNSDLSTGINASTTVAIEPGSTVKLTAGGWQVITPVDHYEGRYTSVIYRGEVAREREMQFSADAEGAAIDKVSLTNEIVRELPAADYTPPIRGLIQQSSLRLSDDHFQFVLRDDDRRVIQTIDVVTTINRSETTYRDGQGQLQRQVIVEQLHAGATRTTLIDASGSPTESTVTQRYHRSGEIYDLEDRIDYADGSRILTVRDSLGHITSAESVPIGAMSEAARESVRDQLDDDVADFLTALRQKDTANIILSAARIALDHARAQGLSTFQQDHFVADVSSSLGLLTSLRSIQSGDTLAKLGGAVGLLNSSNYLASRISGSGYLTPAQVGTLSQISAMLAVANLTNLGKMIEAGQIGSAGASVVSAINGVGYLSGASSAMTGAGAIIAINPIALVVAAFALDSLFGNDPPPPPPQASASFFRDPSGALRYRISAANPLGESIMRRELDQLLRELNQQLSQANAEISQPAHQLQFVASRMPTLEIASWPSRDKNGVDNYFFIVHQQDPLQGEIGTLGIARQDLVKLYAETLLTPEAIVQHWEVDHLRAMFGGDEANWLTEAEWLRERSPTERQRAQLQAELQRATTQWKAASQVNLMLSGTLSNTDHRSNVTPLAVSSSAESSARNTMVLAQEKLSKFNSDHPIDPIRAARATPEQLSSFAPQRTRDTVSLQWLKVITVDLGNDGVQLIGLPDTVGTDLESLKQQHIPRFDVDSDGFLEATQWIEPSDAILCIDRSGNDVIDNGSELFNSPDTPFDQHGLASLAYFDANHDGLLTSLDPAFKQLRLWLDLDRDGSAGQLEVFDLWMRSAATPANASPPEALASMVVTAVDLVNASLRFADGGTAKLSQLDLLSHTEGVQISVDENTRNLNVLHESGLRENFITLVDDMTALQELLKPSITEARRTELYDLASRYGLNPFSADFTSIVQSLRASGQTMGTQDTVIYFGDDDIWVDNAVRDRLEQMRISFRKISDAARNEHAAPNIVRVGQPILTESLGDTDPFDDRWVPSRRVAIDDISSDAPTSTTEVTPTVEVRPEAEQVYSLLAATKGAQRDGVVTRIPIINHDPSVAPATNRPDTLYTLTPPVARLNTLKLQSDEDGMINLNYAYLEKDAQISLPIDNSNLQLRVIGLRDAHHGDARIDDERQSLSFQPLADYVGEAGFTYLLADQANRLYERYVSINLGALNDAPRTAGEAIVSTEDTPLLIDTATLLANDRDVEGDQLTVTGIARVALGRAELLGNGMIHYVPPADQYDVTDLIEYIVQDAHGAAATAIIRVALAPERDAPSVVAEQIIHAREDQTLRIPQHLLLRNDLDLDADSRVGAAPLSITAVGAAEHGKVNLEVNGDIIFTPDTNFNGEARFSYTVMNSSGLQTTGFALINIEPVNDAPFSADEHIDSLEDEVLLINPTLLTQNELDLDIQHGETQRLTVIGVDKPVGGTVKLIDGMIQFTPDADLHGNAGFQYTVSDGAGGFTQASATISLAAVNDAPRLPIQRVNIQEDSQISFPSSLLLDGVIDIDSDVRNLSLASITNVRGGTLIQKDSQLTFCPFPDFSGTACFDYTVADDLGASSTATLMIDVNAINDAPALINDAYFEPIGNEDQEIRIAESALLKMFIDADGDPLCIESSSLKALTAGDTIRFDEVRKELIFRAAANANGIRQLSFKVTDGTLNSAAVTLGVMLRPVNDAPTVNSVGFQMLEDGGANNPTQSHWSYLSHKLLLSGASDIEDDALTITNITAAQTIGVANPQPVEIFNDLVNQRIGLRAPLNYTGAVAFDFTVSDGQGGETTQRAYGSVAAVNDVPFLTAQRISVSTVRVGRSNFAELSSWQVSAWDPDAGQPTQISVVRNPLHGSVRIEGTSTTPDPRGGLSTSASIASNSGVGGTTSNETAWFSATDSAGASAQISISFTGRYSTDPIVIDLGRDGFNFMDIDQSSVSFNVEGEQRRSAWIGPSEGILAFDADFDGRIQRLEEISFGSHVGDTTLSDLQALQRPYFDQNQDGVFDRNDARWSNFFLWRDINSNGVSDSGELVNLTAAGVEGLYLNANVLNRAEGADVRVRGYSRVLMNDGRLLQAADVWLGLDHPDRHNGAIPDPSMQQVSLLGSDQFSQLLKQLAQAPQRGNRAPLVYGYLPTQFAEEGQLFQLSIAPNFFLDVDTNDPVSIAARLADGSPLPAWLTWDPVRLSFYGVPRESDIGTLQLALIATDRQAASTSTGFTLATSAINRAPALNPAFANLDWKISQSSQFKIPDNLFIDPNQDDALRYQFTMADGNPLPDWLRFDPVSNTLSSDTALGSMFKPVQLKLTASDRGGLSTSTVLSVVTSTTGTNSDDNLWGASADDILRGFGGNDLLDGKGGNDQLSGGSGDDTLIGGSGSDTYVFERGWGWDEIRETASSTDRNIIRFADGIRPSDILLSRDLSGLYARNILNNNFISISTEGSNGAPTYQPGLIAEIQFSRGEVWNALSDQEIMFEGMLDFTHTEFTGSVKDDLIWTSWLSSTVQGGLGNDMLFGNRSADQLFGGAGNDMLDGGSGDDLLSGGLGDDLYRVSTASGNKTVNDLGGIDTLELHGVNSRADLALSRAGVDLIAGFRNSQGSVTVKNFFGTDGAVNTTAPIDWFQFDNGSKISAAGLLPSIELSRTTNNLGGFLNYTSPTK